nr:ABC transporter permease subunit [uncultured Oribacterium sp.]
MNGISKDYGAVSSVEELLEQEEKGKTKREKKLELLVQGSPFLMGVLALLEYFYVPNHQGFEASYVYAFFLLLLLVGNGISFLLSFRGKRQRKNYLYHAPFRVLVFFLFTLYDLLTLKSNILITPYFPSIDKVLSSMVQDRAYLCECTMSSLFLLFCGYFSGLIVGLLTGIACGYNKKINYWIEPFMKLLGSIPSTTWIPIVMVLATSLFRGSVFIIALGVWFSITLATITGIRNMDKSYYEAARTLGAKEKDLILEIAIPSALPSIFQGMVQAMSSACMALMVAEMIGVESGLGWYITWQKSWAEYGKMYGAIILICCIFVTVNFLLNSIKKRVLRWQEGMLKD